MHRSRPLGAFVVATLLALPGAGPAPADTWRVEGKLHGRPKAAEPDTRKAEDVSGVACATTAGYPRLCLVADDNSQGVQVVILERDRLVAGRFLPLVYDTHEGRPLDLDAEAVAYADGAFYVAGSHGRPRHRDGDGRADAQTRASSRLFRIRFAPDGVDMATGAVRTPPRVEPSTELPRFIAAQAPLRDALDKPLDPNGLTVEGLALRGGRVLVGMRGPVSGEDALVLEVPAPALFDGAPGEGTLHRLNLGRDRDGKPRGVRDLVAHDQSILVVAGPVLDPADRDYAIREGDYAIYAWEQEGHAPRKLLDLPGYGARMKPEALLPLQVGQGRLRALIFLDGPEEGGPRLIEIPLR